MYLNNFSVRIVGGKEQSGGYVEMEHGKHYTLALRNDRNVECDAYVEIDGKHVGIWRIWAHNSISLERPANDNARFTFYEVGTQEAADAQLKEGDPNLGLVKVTFTPAKKREVKPLKEHSPLIWDPSYPVEDSVGDSSTSSGGSYSAMNVSYNAGGTGLSGHSNQHFVPVGAIDPDMSQQTAFHLRLVGKKAEAVVRPLTSYSTPVPPPVP